MKRNLKRLAVLLVTVAMISTSVTFKCTALAEETTPEVPTPTPEVEVIVITPAVPTPEPQKMERPKTVVYCYEWVDEFVEDMAKAYWCLDTFEEKLAFTITVVNRYLSGAVRADGKLLFGDGTIEGVLKKSGEYEFFSEDSYASKDNKELAEYLLNACMTARLTKEYTGYAIPSNALYFGTLEDGTVALYSELGREPIYKYQKIG
jgi:hypothetical protein